MLAHGEEMSAQRWYSEPMRSFCAVLIMALAANHSVFAQVHGREATAHGTVNVAELARLQRDHPPVFVPPPPGVPRLTGSRRESPRNTSPGPRSQPPSDALRTALSLPTAQVASPAPAANFEALVDNNTKIPPGTNGAAGPNHLMVTTNSEVRIEDRSGVEISKVTLESFWASVITVSSGGVYDPHIAYDRVSARWIFSAASAKATAGSSLLIGVSQSNNPTGTWNLYRQDIDGSDVTYGDFPTLGFNRNWIVVSVNVYYMAGNGFVGTDLFVFRKPNLLSGAAALFTYIETAAFTQVPAITYDSYQDTMYLVEDLDGDFGGIGRLGMSTITGPIGSEVYTDLAQPIIISATWASSPSGMLDFATQSGTAEKIQNGDSRIASVVYRNGYLWTAQNVFLPTANPTRTGVQWAQFSPDGTVQQTYQINSAGMFYAYPSIAVNSVNDVLLGFSVFSASQFPSAAYVMRKSDDALNSMRDVVVLKAGEAAYVKRNGGTANSWGDYSATMVDPVNDLDFWTIQEYASSPLFPNPNPGKWGTWWGKFSNLTTPPAPSPKRRRQLTGD